MAVNDIMEHHSPEVLYGNANKEVIPRGNYDKASGLHKETGTPLLDEVQWAKCGSVLLHRADRPDVTKTSTLLAAYTVRAVLVSIKGLANWIGDNFFLLMPSVAVRFILDQLTTPTASALQLYDWSFEVSLAFLVLGGIYGSLKNNRAMLKDFPQNTPVCDVRTSINSLDLLYYFPPADLPGWMRFLFGNPLFYFLDTEEVGRGSSNGNGDGNPNDRNLQKTDKGKGPMTGKEKPETQSMSPMELSPSALQDKKKDKENDVRVCSISARDDSQVPKEKEPPPTELPNGANAGGVFSAFRNLHRLATSDGKAGIPKGQDLADEFKQDQQVIVDSCEPGKKLP